MEECTPKVTVQFFERILNSTPPYLKKSEIHSFIIQQVWFQHVLTVGMD